MLSYFSNAFGFHKGKVEDDEARNQEDTHAKEFESNAKVALARAMKVHKVDATMPYASDLTREVVREEVEGVPEAFILHNVLTKEECDAYIEITEKLGYTDAPITTGINQANMMPEVRDNQRVMWEVSNDATSPIWRRIAHLVPNEISNPIPWKVDESNPLNDRFRFYRYDVNQTFRPHFDGCFRRNAEEQSHYTFIVYLNEGFEGGETVFFPEGKNSMWTTKTVTKERRVNPKIGSALVFRHSGVNSPLHEGAPHFTKGEKKYVLRSDIMYKKTQEPLD